VAFSFGTNFRALRSLSQALLRGYFRDRTALAFSILLPVLFLVLFGTLYRSSATPKLTVIEIGNVSLLSHAAGQPGLSGILTVAHNGDKKAAVREGPAAALPAIGILTALTVVLTLISVRVFRWDEI
jgi:ABC-2 type transport system permease protein